ncbi:MAG: AraC family transcriptional regulator [Cyclobacteriaceae bacterium]
MIFDRNLYQFSEELVKIFDFWPMEMEFELLFIIILLSLGVFNSLMLMAKDISVFSNDKFLDASVFFYNIFLLLYFLWMEAGYLSYMPYMLRVLSPLMYLCAPLFYFYVRNSLLNTHGWKKSDWIHFLPVVIHYLDLIPYFLEPSVNKLVYAELVVADPNQIGKVASGWIPIRLHYVFRILLQTGYYIYLLFWIIGLNPRFFKDFFLQASFNWLVIVMVFMGWVVLFQFSFLVTEVLSVLQFASQEDFNSLTRKLSLVGIFLLNLYINFKPKQLYKPLSRSRQGDQRHPTSNKTVSDIDGVPVPIDEDENTPIKRSILNLLEEDKVFLKVGMDLGDFSKCLGIPKNQVSHVINKEFGKRFNEFLNHYRINHAVHLIEQGYLDDFTLEALAEQSGFNSRITFFNAFKKEMGTSPSEFWKSFQENII